MLTAVQPPRCRIEMSLASCATTMSPRPPTESALWSGGDGPRARKPPPRSATVIFQPPALRATCSRIVLSGVAEARTALVTSSETTSTAASSAAEVAPASINQVRACCRAGARALVVAGSVHWARSRRVASVRRPGGARRPCPRCTPSRLRPTQLGPTGEVIGRGGDVDHPCGRRGDPARPSRGVAVSPPSSGPRWPISTTSARSSTSSARSCSRRADPDDQITVAPRQRRGDRSRRSRPRRPAARGSPTSCRRASCGCLADDYRVDHVRRPDRAAWSTRASSPPPTDVRTRAADASSRRSAPTATTRRPRAGTRWWPSTSAWPAAWPGGSRAGASRWTTSSRWPSRAS